MAQGFSEAQVLEGLHYRKDKMKGKLRRVFRQALDDVKGFSRVQTHMAKVATFNAFLMLGLASEQLAKIAKRDHQLTFSNTSCKNNTSFCRGRCFQQHEHELLNRGAQIDSDLLWKSSSQESVEVGIAW